MSISIRNVVAKYLDDPNNEYVVNKDKTFDEHIVEKNKPLPVSKTILEMLKNVDQLGASFNITNPYDYTDPSTKPKDQRDGPPFENEISEPTMFGYYTHPKIWTDTPYYKYWKNIQQIEDPTEDEDEQRPAISITRKCLASDIGDIVIPVDEFEDFVMRCKVAASLSEIIDKDYHYKNDLKINRAKKCNVIWINKNKPNQYERGLFIFKVSTPGSEFKAHTVYIQFLRDEKIDAKRYIECPVHIGCTCPSFLYYGAQYYAVKGGYMYMPAFKPDLVAPHPQNVYRTHISDRYPKGKKHPGRGLNFRVCKHILAVFDKIKNFPIEVHYKKYPITSPPSKIINVKVWKDIMKFEFTEQNIKQRLMSPYPKVPAYFNREAITPAVIEWFYTSWFPRTDEQKIKALQEFAMYPERIYFILIEEAYLKRKQGQKISKKLVDEGYRLMSKVIQPDNKAKPQIIPEYKNIRTKGTGKIDLPQIKSP